MYKKKKKARRVCVFQLVQIMYGSCNATYFLKCLPLCFVSNSCSNAKHGKLEMFYSFKFKVKEIPKDTNKKVQYP
jgi:hypothetical protein